MGLVSTLLSNWHNLSLVKRLALLCALWWLPVINLWLPYEWDFTTVAVAGFDLIVWYWFCLLMWACCECIAALWRVIRKPAC